MVAVEAFKQTERVQWRKRKTACLSLALTLSLSSQAPQAALAQESSAEQWCPYAAEYLGKGIRLVDVFENNPDQRNFRAGEARSSGNNIFAFVTFPDDISAAIRQSVQTLEQDYEGLVLGSSDHTPYAISIENLERLVSEPCAGISRYEETLQFLSGRS